MDDPFSIFLPWWLELPWSLQLEWTLEIVMFGWFLTEEFIDLECLNWILQAVSRQKMFVVNVISAFAC